MSEPSLDLKKRNVRNLILFLLPGIISAAVVYKLWSAHPDLAYWKGLLDELRAFLADNPWALILTVATLPGLGVPISPILILFGIVMQPQFGVIGACAIGIAAQSLCSIWTYFLASGILRDFLRNYVLRNRALPELNHRNALRLGFIIRIAPGFPYALQNIVLGVLGLPFKTYLLVSIPVNSLYTIGFIVTGGAIFEGQVGLALTGALLLVVVILATRMIRSRAQNNVG
ncbi:MAG: TVP38/TMEM64 family protein [Coraliomargarita sp.]